jgi:hypothetical protein
MFNLSFLYFDLVQWLNTGKLRRTRFKTWTAALNGNYLLNNRLFVYLELDFTPCHIF